MYTVQILPSGVAHIYFQGSIFCSVHHAYAGGIQQARERAEMIANLLNQVVA